MMGGIWKVKNKRLLNYLCLKNYYQGQETRWNPKRGTDLEVLTLSLLLTALWPWESLISCGWRVIISG